MFYKTHSADKTRPELNAPRMKLFSKIINVGLFAALGGGAAAACSLTSNSISRSTTKSAVVYVAENAALEKPTKVRREVFSSFGKTTNKSAISKPEPSTETLEFLQQNG